MCKRLIFLAAVLLIVSSFADARAERLALVVGNSAYGKNMELKNPRNDAQALSGELTDFGFHVIVGLDLTRNQFEDKIQEFARASRGAEAAIFFYAGHGIQVGSSNYLIPVDANIRDETDLEFETIRLNTIIGLMERKHRTNIVFLDACRDNPMSRSLARSMGTRSLSVGRGLAPVETGIGTLIGYATQPGNVAYDGDGRNSPFTTALLRHMSTPGLDVELMMRRVRRDVMAATDERQVPWSSSSLTGAFVFNRADRQSTPAVAGLAPAPAFREADSRSKPPDVGVTAAAAPAAAADQPVEVAAIDPAATMGANEPPAPAFSEWELARSMQRELNRLGCEAGAEDGVWGRKSSAALEQLAEHESTVDVAALEPNEALLRQIQRLDGRICPVVCSATEDLIDGACVRKTCPSGQRLSAKGACYTPQASASSTLKRKSSGSNCFSFNGSTYCE
ncbi:caspase domain-containing protein [uncultured Roseibium sp.]|uniref:caspase family protein n=1 Tax=uncultured Roseibium sp. TaxID=1936171 RepID=UPI003217C3A2